MTGPEHYKEAEKDIAAMAGKNKDAVMALLAMAQVHATLALAAATALGTVGQPTEDYHEWRGAALLSGRVSS